MVPLINVSKSSDLLFYSLFIRECGEMHAEQIFYKLLKSREVRPYFTEVHGKGSEGFSGPQGQCAWLCLGWRMLVLAHASKRCPNALALPLPQAWPLETQ